MTGTSGVQKHMGNMICEGRQEPEEVDNADGVNVVSLQDRLTIGLYPTPHSDIVALMVLEHQVGMLNRLARAGLETRSALYYEREMNKALGRPEGTRSDSARSRIRNVGEAVVRYMLMAEEAPLTGRIEGTSTFASDFAGRGPRDTKGRSLRDFDLETRLFRHPCSYLIDSRAFDSLPGEVKEYIYQRLWEILNGRATGKDDPEIAAGDREAILAILRETKSDLPTRVSSADIVFGLAEDLEDRLAVLRGDLGVVLPGPPAVEDLPESLIDVFLHLAGEGVEGPGIDQVAARVTEQPGLEVEVAERPALRVAGPRAGEVGREGGRALDAIGQAGLVAKSMYWTTASPTLRMRDRALSDARRPAGPAPCSSRARSAAPCASPSRRGPGG